MYSKYVDSPDEHDSFACEVMYLNNDSVRALNSDDMISEAIVHYGCKILFLAVEDIVSRQAKEQPSRTPV